MYELKASEELSKEQWIQYIRELKRAELNKLNSSIKYSAILIFVVAAINSLMKDFNYIMNKENICVLMLFLAIEIYFITVLFRIFNKVFRKETIAKFDTKRFNDLEKQAFLIGYISEIIYSIIKLIIYIFFIRDCRSKYISNILPFKIFIAIVFLMFLWKLVVMYINYFQNQHKNFGTYIKQYKKEKEYVQSRKWFEVFNKIVKYLANITYAVIFIYIGYEMVKIGYKLIIQEVEYKLFIDSLYIMSVIASIQIFSFYVAAKIKHSWLEEFEKKIFFENLSVNEIKNIISSEYINNIKYDLIYYRDK